MIQGKVAMRPGQIVPVDQLEPTTPGFIMQIKCKLTNNDIIMIHICGSIFRALICIPAKEYHE